MSMPIDLDIKPLRSYEGWWLLIPKYGAAHRINVMPYRGPSTDMETIMGLVHLEI